MRVLRSRDNITLVIKFLRQQVTEERTGLLIDKLIEKINFPRWVPKFILRRVLGAIPPDKLLDAIESFLIDLGDETDGSGIASS